MGISKITRNYQVTLPKDIREMKNLHVGETVFFVTEGDRVELVKMNKDVVRAAAGLWAGMKENGIEFERRVRAGWKKRKAF